MKRFFVFAFLISIFAACSDDNDPGAKPTDPEIVPVAANYVVSDDEISEQSALHTVTILLSEAAQANGSLEITLSGDIETGYFTTEPAVSGGKITLTVTEGDTEVSFDVLPVNNEKLNGNKTVSFLLANATGSVVLGESIEHLLTLTDDELANKLMTYEKKGSGLSSSKNRYEYNEAGLVSKIHWQANNVFGTTTGTTEYSYNEAGGIILISRSNAAQQTRYVWEDGFMVRIEKVQDDAVLSYDTYEYDEAGRLATVNLFTKNMVGELASTNRVLYDYFEDGNVHHVVQQAFNKDLSMFVANMITTYDGYIEGHNPDALEVIPNQKLQTKLPTYYSRAVTGETQEYEVAYEFSENGNLSKKTVTGAVADSGVTNYTYY